MAHQFTDRELDIMEVLWRRGSATANEVRDELDELGHPLAYNTVLTILRILEDKGHVRHDEEGRAFRYVPLVARQEAKTSAVSRLVEKLFDGQPKLLATQLLSERTLSDDDLREIQNVLDKRLRTPRAGRQK
jgi:BlaI family penicillinase repressor